MIKWLLSFFTTRQAVLDLTEQLIRLRSAHELLNIRIRDMENDVQLIVADIIVSDNRLERLEQAEKLNARVPTAKRETPRNWSAFRQMAEQAEGVESADR